MAERRAIRGGAFGSYRSNRTPGARSFPAASLPETAERDSAEIDLQLALGMSSIRAKGMISPAVGEAYGRAAELAEKHRDQHRLFQAIYGVYQHNVGSARIFAARPLAERLLAVTEHDDADPERLHKSLGKARVD